MSVHINGYWVKKSHLRPSLKLAKLYAWKHHTIFGVVKKKSDEWVAGGGKTWEWERNEYPAILRVYQADPDFTTVQIFDWGNRYFIRWLDYISGYEVYDMVDELMLPWKHEWYDGRVMEGTIDHKRAWQMSDRIDEEVYNGTYFYTPIIQRTDPTRAILMDIWPPMIKELRSIESVRIDGMEAAPIPVFVDYSKRG